MPYANPEDYKRYHRDYYQKNRDAIVAKVRERRRKDPSIVNKYNRARAARNKSLDEVQRVKLLEAQSGLCYLCEQPLDIGDAVLDHDHRCCPKGFACHRCQRGLAHNNCNTLIGLACDDPEMLVMIAANLTRAIKGVDSRLDGPDATLFSLGNAS